MILPQAAHDHVHRGPNEPSHDGDGRDHSMSAPRELVCASVVLHLQNAHDKQPEAVLNSSAPPRSAGSPLSDGANLSSKIPWSYQAIYVLVPVYATSLIGTN